VAFPAVALVALPASEVVFSATTVALAAVAFVSLVAVAFSAPAVALAACVSF
jgi:hypothetical protein